MFETEIAAFEGPLRRAVDAVRTLGSTASADDLRAVLHATRRAERLIERLRLESTAPLARNGLYVQAGYRRPESAVADLLTIERTRARRIVLAAQQVCAGADPNGHQLPAGLPATAAAFASGAAGLRHVEVITALMDRPAARRLDPQAWATAERAIAARTDTCTPTELRIWGAMRIDQHARNGPDHPASTQVNKLRITSFSRGGGRIAVRIDDPVRFATITEVINSRSAPLVDDDRPLAERRADALADVCGLVASSANAHATSRKRPSSRVTGGPTGLGRSCPTGRIDAPTTRDADAVARRRRLPPHPRRGRPAARYRPTLSAGLGSAVIAPDRDCAHPDCGPAVSWYAIYHVHHCTRAAHSRRGNVEILLRGASRRHPFHRLRRFHRRRQDP